MVQEAERTREIVPGHQGLQSPDMAGRAVHTSVMQEATARDAALVRTCWVVAALAVALYATIPLSLSGGVMSRPGIVNPTRTSDVVEGLVIFLFLSSGAWLIQARPRNLIGWLVLASGALQRCR